MIFIYIIQFVSTVISILLNVKYMVEASPTNSDTDIGIGIIVGGLIPIFVILFGYIEGHVYDTRVDIGVFKTNGKHALKEAVRQAVADDPSITQRGLAKMLNKSPATINSIVKELQIERLGGDNGR